MSCRPVPQVFCARFFVDRLQAGRVASLSNQVLLSPNDFMAVIVLLLLSFHDEL